MPDEATMSPAEMLEEFHRELGDERGRGGAALRITLHKEEHEELLAELGDAKAEVYVDVRERIARELADVVYVAYGTAHAFDLDLDAALAEVHRAAMSKLHPPCEYCQGAGEMTRNEQTLICSICFGSGEGERVVRSDGKVCKPPGFVPPDMSRAVL